MSGDRGGSTASTTSTSNYDQRMVLDGGSIGVTSSSGNSVVLTDNGAVSNALRFALDAAGLANNTSMGSLAFASKSSDQALQFAEAVGSDAMASVGTANTQAIGFAGKVLELGAQVLAQGQAAQGQQADYLATAYTDAKGTKDVLVAGALLIGGVVAISFLRK